MFGLKQKSLFYVLEGFGYCQAIQAIQTIQTWNGFAAD